jgi:hypothetical protein
MTASTMIFAMPLEMDGETFAKKLRAWAMPSREELANEKINQARSRERAG